MMHVDVYFSTDDNVWVTMSNVGKEVKSEEYGAIGGVFKRDDAAMSGAGLNGAEDIFDGYMRNEVEENFVKGIE